MRYYVLSLCHGPSGAERGTPPLTCCLSRRLCEGAAIFILVFQRGKWSLFWGEGNGVLRKFSALGIKQLWGVRGPQHGRHGDFTVWVIVFSGLPH